MDLRGFLNLGKKVGIALKKLYVFIKKLTTPLKKLSAFIKKLSAFIKKLSAFIKELTTLITTSFVAVIIVLFVYYRHDDISEFIMRKGQITSIGGITTERVPKPIRSDETIVEKNESTIDVKNENIIKNKNIIKEAEIGNENSIQEGAIK